MIIFGWGRQTTTNIGMVFKQLCNHCHNEEYWILIRKTTWFTLFFIPIIPYETEYWLLCPVCKYGLKLSDEQIKIFRPLAELNQLLNTNQITTAEYESRVAVLNEQPANKQTESLPEAEKEVKEESKTKLKYCSGCGKELVPDSHFCTHCGSKIGMI